MLCEHAPTLEMVTPDLIESLESSTGICKVSIDAYIERIRRKIPFAYREAYLSRPTSRYSPADSPEGSRRNSTEGIMHFDVDPNESIHWNFPVPLTDGTGDMTLRNMVVTVDVAHELLQLQFDADIRVQVDEPLRLRKDSRDVDPRVDVSMQTDMDPVIPRFVARFSGRVMPHSSSTLDTPHPISRQRADACCVLH